MAGVGSSKLSAAAAIFFLTVPGCESQCPTRPYCRVSDVLANCTYPACTLTGGTRRYVAGDDTIALSNITPHSISGAPVVLVMHLSEFAEQRAGYDLLRLELAAAAPVPSSSVSLSSPSANEACKVEDLSPIYTTVGTCDLALVGDETLTLTIEAPYPSFTLRAFFQESTCTGRREVCEG